MSAPSCMSRNTSGPPVSCGGGGIPAIPGRLHCPRGLVEVPHFSSTRGPPHFYSAVPNSFVRREILEAQACQAPIIPLITSSFDPADVPIHIKNLTWLPFADFKAHLPGLLKRLTESPGDVVPAQPPYDPFRGYVEYLRDFVTKRLSRQP